MSACTARMVSRSRRLSRDGEAVLEHRDGLDPLAEQSAPSSPLVSGGVRPRSSWNKGLSSLRERAWRS